MLSVVLVIPDQDPDLRVIPDGIRALDLVHIHHELVVVVAEVMEDIEADPDPPVENVVAEVTGKQRNNIPGIPTSFGQEFSIKTSKNRNWRKNRESLFTF